jgi:5-methyltetrahydropteroyltriglutamate--homocysteine methyltransferase
MKLSRERILTSHVGSLPRSAEVLRVLDRRENEGPLDVAEFDRVMDAAVTDIVARQVRTGIDVVSDGEMSKISYATYVHDRLAGFSSVGSTEASKPHLDVAPFPAFREKMEQLTGKRRFKRVTCVGPISVGDRSGLDRDLKNMRSAIGSSKPEESFLNAASPGIVASFLVNAYYPTYEAYVEAIALAMREEYQAIVTAGFLLQVDCPDLAMSRHTLFQDLTEAEFLKRIELHVEALNLALEGIPAECVRYHICWGNYEGPHHHDIDLRKIVDVALKVKARGILLEAANPRHEHEWSIWRERALPDDKVLLPGVIDTSTNYVEHPDLVAERIVRFANVVGRERVIASTDCGFGTSAGFGKLDPDISFLKLATLVEGAARASRQLWGPAASSDQPRMPI